MLIGALKNNRRAWVCAVRCCGAAAACCVLVAETVCAGMVYQNFEPDNGTPKKYPDSAIAQPEYGWEFGGAVVGLSVNGEPVHSGNRSWKVTVPSGQPVQAGTGIPSQVETYDMTFLPVCHDRLTFWVWSDPSTAGDHNVLVKLFDKGAYQHVGFGLWTIGRARDHQWSQLQVLFSELPADFDVEHVDKIEFFNYWDGTYYYDDIEVRSGHTLDEDVACLEAHHVIACTACDASSLPAPTRGSAASPAAGIACGAPEKSDRAMLALPTHGKRCVWRMSRHAELMADYAELRAAGRLTLLEELDRNAAR